MERDIARFTSRLKQATEGTTASKVKQAGEGKPSYALPYCGQARLLSIRRIGLSRDLIMVSQCKEYCTAARKELPEAPAWAWCGNQPVVNATCLEPAGQSEHVNFCRYYSNKYGLSARLPSEEVWQFALGGGNRQCELELPFGLMASATWTSVGNKRMETAPVSRQDFIHENAHGVRNMKAMSGNGHQVCLRVPSLERIPSRNTL